jgi:signal transduction histidine kinase
MNVEKILDSIESGVIVVDEDLVVHHWNEWMEVNTSVKADEILSKAIYELFTEIDIKILQKRVKSALILGTPIFMNSPYHRHLINIPLQSFVKSPFRKMQQSITISPVDIENGLVSIIITDNTQLILAQSTLKRKSDELQELNTSLEDKIKDAVEHERKQTQLIQQQAKLALMGEMIHNIAHQWRQPLAAIANKSSYLQLMEQTGEMSSDILMENTEEILDITEQMSQTINDFMNFFKTNKTFELIPISTIINDTEKIIKETFNKHRIKLNVEYNQSNLKITTIISELRQILLNILTNAKDQIVIQSSKNKSNDDFSGLVNITVTDDILKIHDREIEACRIDILDNGGGIDQIIIDRVFEPYFTTKKGNQGTGIGLYMSKVIIEEHLGGKVSVNNNKFDNGEVGAVFSIILPVLKPDYLENQD